MKLLDPVRDKMRFLHYALDTEKSYLRWIEQYIRFHKVDNEWRHPRDLREAEIEAFLTTWPWSVALRPAHRIRRSRRFCFCIGTSCKSN